MQSNEFLIKLLLRRANSNDKLNNSVQAFEDLKAIFILDEKNEEARLLRNKIEDAKNHEEALKYKETATELVK